MCLSQEQEIVQLVCVCNVLPSLNASTKNTQLECRTWQQGQVGGLGFVATLRAYFDMSRSSHQNLNLAPWFCFNLLFCSGRVFMYQGIHAEAPGADKRGIWERYSWCPGGVFWKAFFSFLSCQAAMLILLVPINTWNRNSVLGHMAYQLVPASNLTSTSPPPVCDGFFHLDGETVLPKNNNNHFNKWQSPGAATGIMTVAKEEIRGHFYKGGNSTEIY